MNSVKSPKYRPRSLAYRSVLWNHIPRIEELIEDGATWREITDDLRQYGIQFHLSSVFQFYKRWKSHGRPFPDTVERRFLEAPRKQSIMLKPDIRNKTKLESAI